jgi:rubrerythrin
MREGEVVERGFTRAGALRAAFGGAVAAGGAAFVSRGGAGSVHAAPSHQTDTKILDFVLKLELVQVAFYEAALEARKLDGEALQLALAVREQERRHVAFLRNWLKGAASPAPKTNFGDAVSGRDAFVHAAVDLEEAAIAGYIGQSGHITRATMVPIATLVSVEARQVAWLRDLAGVNPAPKAMDPPRKAEDVMAFLRDKGYVS